jgi:hypothetical protein
VNSDGVRRWSRRKEQDAGNVNGGALVRVQDDAPPTTCEGVDYYTHSAVVVDGAYSIEVTTYPDDGKVAGYNVAFSQDGVEWHELGNRLGLGGAKSLAQQHADKRGPLGESSTAALAPAGDDLDIPDFLRRHAEENGGTEPNAMQAREGAAA